jgi:isopentenyl phosphate kinase
MLIFLKLGGSLITNKLKPYSVRMDIIDQVIHEIKIVQDEFPSLQILLGHGSGSFGHTPASKFKTIDGVQTIEQWDGFLEVWKEARALNQIVMDSLLKANTRAISFAPSAQILAHDRRIIKWDISHIETAIANHLIPVVFGDVVFDSKRNGTVLSTEDLFFHLANFLLPDRILLAGIEDGVFFDFPKNLRLVKHLSPAEVTENSSWIGGSNATDVTGGMLQKVTKMTELVDHKKVRTVSIFNGRIAGNIRSALLGEYPGTTISMEKRL